jgi:hypothetical protein
MTNKPKPRLFFTCPIKAAYMGHKFGVITYVELSIKSEIYDKYFIKDWNHRELKLDPKEEHYCDKYYVAKESEHIFEPKNYDLAGFTRDDGISTIGQYDEAKKAFINGSFRILKKYNPKIIMRDNKQFFMPEVVK